MKPIPTGEVITTREAARWWGCSPEMLRYYMRSAGIHPVQLATTQREGRLYYWRTKDILAVYAHRTGESAAPPGVSWKAKRAIDADKRARDALRREQQRERWTRYWRAKAAAKMAAKAAAKTKVNPQAGGVSSATS